MILGRLTELRYRYQEIGGGRSHNAATRIGDRGEGTGEIVACPRLLQRSSADETTALPHLHYLADGSW